MMLAVAPMPGRMSVNMPWPAGWLPSLWWSTMMWILVWGGTSLFEARARAVHHRKVRALLECLGRQVLHLDIEQVHERPVFLVADVTLSKKSGW